MISKIRARGHMVEIVSSEKGAELISRKEALERARAIIGIDGTSEQLVEQLVKAACEAKLNDDGIPYNSKSVELLLKTAEQQAHGLPD